MRLRGSAIQRTNGFEAAEFQTMNSRTPDANRNRVFDPAAYRVEEVLRDGHPVLIRAIRPDDKQRLAELHGRLSSEAIYYRFLGAKKRLTSAELAYLTELDFRRQAALVAILVANGSERIAGVGRYACEPGGPDDQADVAITVEDAEQGRGIGTLLLKHLMRVAGAEGVTKFDAHLLSENQKMMRLLERTGLVLQRVAEGGMCHLTVSTDARPTSFPGSPS
jgi:RimJ/RimL family protein N-acetyltransferase